MKIPLLNSSLKIASRNSPSGKMRSRPLLVKPSLPSSVRAPASLLRSATNSTTAIATRIPARARANVDIIFRGVPDIRDVSHNADAPQPAACSPRLEYDVTSLILSAPAESTYGQSNGPECFDITSLDSLGGPEARCGVEYTALVAQVDLFEDDLPDFDEDEHMVETLKAAPPQVRSTLSKTEAYSDADDNDLAFETLFGSMGLHSDDASSLDAGFFLDNILSPPEDGGLFLASPHFDGLTPYDPEAFLDDPDFALEMACLFLPPLATSSPVQLTKRRRSESHHDDVNVSLRCRKEPAHTSTRSVTVSSSNITSTEHIHYHVTTADMDIVFVDDASP